MDSIPHRVTVVISFIVEAMGRTLEIALGRIASRTKLLSLEEGFKFEDIVASIKAGYEHGKNTINVLAEGVASAADGQN